ncbi:MULTISPECIES: hypothetical protein [unclassified Bartonella]|uniref:hypothetical protein n=1 Tax=unclassified Bartonella TaxID=2645622 RepID=UPI0035D0BC6F
MREAKPNPLDNKPDCLQIVVYRLALFKDRWGWLCPFGESQQSMQGDMYFSLVSGGKIIILGGKQNII